MLETLNREANTGLKDPALANKLMVQGIVPRPLGLDEAQAFVRSESAKFAHIAKAAHIEVSN